MCFFVFIVGLDMLFCFWEGGMGMGGGSGLEIVSDFFLKPSCCCGCCCCCCCRKTLTHYQIDGNESNLSTLQHFLFLGTQIIKLSKSSPNMPPSSELSDYLRVDDLGD